MKLTTYITCEGAIRGTCGYHHATLKNAVRCLRHDEACACEAGEDYDRQLVIHDNGAEYVVPGWLLGWDMIGDGAMVDRDWPIERVIALVKRS